MSKQVKWKLRKGDRVRVVAGKSKGVEGEILEVMRNSGKVIVENANLAKRHTKPDGENPGGIIEKSLPLDISNVMLIDPKSGEPTRVGRRVEDGKIVRFSKKSGETIK